MAVTIRDVAQAAGVHVSTVSRTFTAPQQVNEDTRNRVIEVARELGYRPNRAARSLTTGRTNNIGLIVADLANPFFSSIIKAAQAHARERDYHVFVADTDEDPAVEEELVQAFTKQVDGVILCSPRITNRVITRLAKDVPFVVVNRRLRGYATILMDVAQGSRLAIEHLRELGHRKIAVASGPSGSWTSAEMVAAARAVKGIEVETVGPNTPTEQGGIAAAAEVARSGVTAVLAHNDLLAIGLIEGLTELGLDVPGDMSVVGVDDSLLGRLNRPKLTTVTMPTAAAGRLAVDLLLQSVTAATTLETSLVIRESTAPPKGHP
ncbi:LacI family DNA-binding transcriptional regulator [Streptosporangiaceae bacterium NEAU-GS5]|nr:LacI family DNA-binding transcriptional regulator [Streptosporangiaceae bacterium NEAU-GS5]